MPPPDSIRYAPPPSHRAAAVPPRRRLRTATTATSCTPAPQLCASLAAARPRCPRSTLCTAAALRQRRFALTSPPPALLLRATAAF